MREVIETVPVTEFKVIEEEKDLQEELKELKTTLGRIRGLEETCRLAGQKVANVRSELKAAREEYDEAVMALRDAIRERDEILPLFDQQPQQDAVSDDAWRDVTIEDAGIPVNICALLREHKPRPIVTVGDIGRMKVSTAQVVTVTAEMTLEQAEWLMGVMQNPLHGEHPHQEHPDSCENRREFFTAMKEALRLVHGRRSTKQFVDSEFAIARGSQEGGEVA